MPRWLKVFVGLWPVGLDVILGLLQAMVEMHRVGAAMHQTMFVCCLLRPAAVRFGAHGKLQDLIQQQSM